MRKILIAAACVVAVIVIAALVIPPMVPTDTYKSRLIAAVKAKTGRDLTISGPVRLSLLPSIGLSAKDVVLTNAAGASSPNMAQFKSIDVKLRLLPLLRGVVVVNRFVLDQPVIALEVDRNGRPNWAFGDAAAQPAPAAAPARANADTDLALSGLNNVRLVNGEISYLDQRTGKRQTLSAVDLKLEHTGMSGRLTADGSALWNNQKGTISLTIDRPDTLAGGGTSPVSFKFTAPSIDVAFSGKATGAALEQLAGTADVTLGSINGKGDLTIDTRGVRPVITGQLAVGKLDLNPYLPPENAPAGHAASAGWSTAPIDFSALKSADAELDLKVGSIRYRKIEIGASDLAVHLKDGRLEADLNDSALYQGKAKGRIVADASTAAPVIQVTASLSGVTIQPLLRDAAGMDKLSGTGNFAIDVTGHGASQRDIVASLDGKGSFGLANGAYTGADILGIAREASAALSNPTAALSGIGSSGGGSQKTIISSLTGTYVIAAGVLRNNDLKVISSDVPITGAGTVDLPKRAVDYRVTPTLAGAAIPVMISGTWDDLHYQPDLSHIAGASAKMIGNAASKIGGTVSSGASGVGGALQGLLGGGK